MYALVASGQTSAVSRAAELDVDLLRHLRWGSCGDALRQIIHEEVNRARKVRHLLPSFPIENLDPDAIPDYSIQDEGDEADDEDESPTPSPFGIPVRQRLVSVKIASEFRVSRAQLGDAGAAMHLVTRAANRLGLAEDAVLMYGPTLVKTSSTAPRTESVRGSGFASLRIQSEHLAMQDKYLYKGNLVEVRNPDSRVTGWRSDQVVNQKHRILESILQGIKELQATGHYGEYCVILAPDLHQAAFTPHSFHREDYRAAAPIFQIRPLLRKDGLSSSKMALDGTGVIFSTGGGAISLAVPEEAHLAFVSWQRDVILSVEERFRLLIQDDAACRPLRDPPPGSAESTTGEDH